MIKKAVILVAGLGTRLLPATKSQPKEMLPVGRKPAVQHIVEELASAGISEILFVTGRHKRSIEDHFDYDDRLISRLAAKGSTDLVATVDGHDIAVRFFYTRQSLPLGTADAIRRAREFTADEAFVVALGDSIIKAQRPGELLLRMIRSHQEHGAVGTIAVEQVRLEDVRSYGIVSPKGTAAEDFEIADVVEKPDREGAPSDLAIAGRYIFDPYIYRAIDCTPTSSDGELQLPESMRVMIREGHMVRAVQLLPDERRYDVGDFERYFKALIDFSFEDPEYGEEIIRYAWQRIRGTNLCNGGNEL